jgi:uncharacterized protein YndB with AHSA1/START domain
MSGKTTTNQTTVTAEPNSPFMTITREFDAPRERVFHAFVDPELVVQWPGPRKYKMEVLKYDATTGGAYHYRHIGEEERDTHEFRGSFHSVDAPNSIVQTFEYLGYPGPVNLEWMTFEDAGNGRTRVVQHAVFQSVENRDSLLQSGMESGVREGYERLDELLKAFSKG